MDIAGLSTVLAQNKVMTNVGYAVLGKELDTAQEGGEDLTKMMELSVNPSVGGNFDMSV